MEKSTNIDRSGENRLLIGAVKACASVAAERHAGEGDLSDVRSRGMRPIRLHLTTTFAIPVATDVTMLLGASSFMTPVGGRVDPRAADAFDAVATAYCNGADLYVPLLSSGLSELPLIDLWNRNAAVQRVVAAEITEDELDAVTALLAEHVAAFIEGDPFAVARWVAFHFSQTTVDVHVRRFHLESIRRAGPTARRIITDMKLPAFRNAVEMIQRDSELSAPREYQSLVGTSEIPSLFHLVVAFVISISIRGYAYAQGLDLLSSRPVYRYHWIRSAAPTSCRRNGSRGARSSRRSLIRLLLSASVRRRGSSM